MGDDLYAEVIPRDRLDVPCRVYAPVGSHEDLLPYLVRRLLENGANSSFVNRITDEAIPPAALVADPVATVEAFVSKPHPNIPPPSDIFADRKNSMQLRHQRIQPRLPAIACEATLAQVLAQVDVGKFRPQRMAQSQRRQVQLLAQHRRARQALAQMRAKLVEEFRLLSRRHFQQHQAAHVHGRTGRLQVQERGVEAAQRLQGFPHQGKRVGLYRSCW